MKEYEGLEGMRSHGHHILYCKCGGELLKVQSGFFGGEYFYCKKENLVYAVRLVKINTNEPFLEQCRNYSDLKETKEMISFKNMKTIKELLTK